MAAIGDFYKIVCDKKNPGEHLQYAIIENGKFVATNGLVLAIVPVDVWIDDLEGYGEGKAFHYDLLRELAKTSYKEIRFTEKTVQAFKKYGSETPDFEALYSAVRDDEKNGRVFYRISPSGEVQEGNFFNYVSYDTVIPEEFGEVACEEVRINPQFLADLSSVFALPPTKGISLRFSAKNKDEKSTRHPIRVTPIAVGGTLADETESGFGIIMPIVPGTGN